MSGESQAEKAPASLTVWVDADACPNSIRQLIINSAERHLAQLVFVASQYLNLPKAPFLSFKQVPVGPDSADHYIRDHVQPGHLVITQDIPLAAEVIARKALAINPHGEIYTEENIRPRLSMRNFMQDLRDTGTHTGGPRPFSENDKKRFADALEKSMVKLKRTVTR